MEIKPDKIFIDRRMVEEARIRSLLRRGLIHDEEEDSLL
jgi:hypothetical protein